MLSRLIKCQAFLEKSNFRCKKIIANFKLLQNCRRRIKDSHRANVLRRQFFAAVLFDQLKGLGTPLYLMTYNSAIIKDLIKHFCRKEVTDDYAYRYWN